MTICPECGYVVSAHGDNMDWKTCRKCILEISCGHCLEIEVNRMVDATWPDERGPNPSVERGND